MRKLSVLVAVLLAFPAFATRPWNGIQPGQSSKEEVVKKFGEPTKAVTSEGKEILAYLGKQAIKGTTQAQFRVDATTKVVERIDVFPGPVIDKETIETNYGGQCPQGTQQASAQPCYLKKLTDDFRTYFMYPKHGLAIFFNEDGKTVHSFIFQVIKSTTPAGR